LFFRQNTADTVQDVWRQSFGDTLNTFSGFASSSGQGFSCGREGEMESKMSSIVFSMKHGSHRRRCPATALLGHFKHLLEDVAIGLAQMTMNQLQQMLLNL
jgi:hypothetical protein